MKRSLFSILTLASCLALNAAAQAPASPATTAPAGPAKIAVVSFQAAVTQTNDFQRRFADLQKKFEPQRQQLKTLNDEIEAIKKQLQAQGATLSDAERATRAKSLDEKQKQFKRIGEDAQNDYQQEMQEIFGAVAAKVGDVLTAYGQQHGYTLVIDGGQQQAPVVLYASPTADITKAVIEAYNVKSGVPAPPAQPAGGAAPKAPGAQ